MAFVQPNTNIWLMKGCFLRQSYEDSYYFADAASQFAYLTQNLIAEYTNYSFQRYNENTIQVDAKIADLFSVNYMAFKNSSHGDRIFYAFVTSVDYINENNVQLTYEIDYIQSFLFDFELMDCFVDRMHSKRDEIGDNILEEPVILGEMLKTSMAVTIPQTEPCIALFYTTDSAGQPISITNFKDGIYSPCKSIANPYSVAGANAIDGMINNYVQNATTNGILSVELMPSFCRSATGELKPYSTTVSIPKPTGNGTIDGYTPRNKKLWCYPYNYFVIASTNNNVSFAYEYFGGNPSFFIYCAGTPNDAVHLRALDYMGQTLSEEDVILSYPPLAFTINTYEEWKARQKATILPRAIGAGIAVANTAINIASFGALQTAVEGSSNNPKPEMTSARKKYQAAQAVSTTATSVISDILSVWSESKLEKLDQISTRGSYNDVSEQVAGFYKYRFYNVHLKAQYAEIIDDFFTGYGYKQGKIMTPSIHNRTGWTYIKTVGCELYSQTVNNGILDRIKAIFDKGIRFWVAGNAEIGDYSGSNTPLG